MRKTKNRRRQPPPPPHKTTTTTQQTTKNRRERQKCNSLKRCIGGPVTRNYRKCPPPPPPNLCRHKQHAEWSCVQQLTLDFSSSRQRQRTVSRKTWWAAMMWSRSAASWTLCSSSSQEHSNTCMWHNHRLHSNTSVWHNHCQHSNDHHEYSNTYM